MNNQTAFVQALHHDPTGLYADCEAFTLEELVPWSTNAKPSVKYKCSKTLTSSN